MSESARDYVLNLALPQAGPVLETAKPFEFSDKQEAVAVGAQLAEFTDAVPAGVRGAIADSILLAQLAANKAAGEAQDVFRWYDKYVEVLQNIGWQIRDVDFQTQTVTDKNAGVHRAIIPVITASCALQFGETSPCA